ncbi:MAG: hypothetical protein KKD92_02580, partial [Proteobacteria bacterium]|nr:hypothetical protein [Pseudomonadota bacterium]
FCFRYQSVNIMFYRMIFNHILLKKTGLWFLVHGFWLKSRTSKIVHGKAEYKISNMEKRETETKNRPSEVRFAFSCRKYHGVNEDAKGKGQRTKAQRHRGVYKRHSGGGTFVFLRFDGES